MTIAATTQTLRDGARNLVMQWTGVSDGNAGGETLVRKVDVSELSPAAEAVSVRKISGTVDFGIVELYWDALTPVKFLELSGDIMLDYERVSGLQNTKPGGWTGDILLSTVGFELDSTYNLLIEMIKK